jgi:AhpD family alkylhydroperoxidase
MKLDDHTIALIAIGAAAAADRASCLDHHLGKAPATGVGADEIAEALDVGRMVRQGAATTLDRLAARLRTGACGCA